MNLIFNRNLQIAIYKEGQGVEILKTFPHIRDWLKEGHKKSFGVKGECTVEVMLDGKRWEKVHTQNYQDVVYSIGSIIVGLITGE
jgi:hypothetical protein